MKRIRQHRLFDLIAPHCVFLQRISRRKERRLVEYAAAYRRMGFDMAELVRIYGILHPERSV